jgi:hypothetical protein
MTLTVDHYGVRRMGSLRRFVGALVLLTVRGALLWVLLIVAPLRKRGVSLGKFLGWLDLNLISAIQRSLARPFFDAAIPWTPLSAAAGVTHRIRLIDPV